MAGRNDGTWALLALDALSLAVRFTVASDVFDSDLGGLAVCGDELFVGKTIDHSIQVLSLAGAPRRVITSQPGGWREPGSLCCVGDRLYLTEMYEGDEEEDEEEEEAEEAAARRMVGRRVFVLTPEGATLQVYNSPKPAEEEVAWRGMCHFDGKLLVADYGQHEVNALRGL